MVATDKQRLQQVILSYQSNALKFTPVNGSIKIEVSQFEKNSKNYLQVLVHDNGCGISKEDQAKPWAIPSSKKLNCQNRRDHRKHESPHPTNQRPAAPHATHEVSQKSSQCQDALPAGRTKFCSLVWWREAQHQKEDGSCQRLPGRQDVTAQGDVQQLY